MMDRLWWFSTWSLSIDRMHTDRVATAVLFYIGEHTYEVYSKAICMELFKCTVAYGEDA